MAKTININKTNHLGICIYFCLKNNDTNNDDDDEKKKTEHTPKKMKTKKEDEKWAKDTFVFLDLILFYFFSLYIPIFWKKRSASQVDMNGRGSFATPCTKNYIALEIEREKNQSRCLKASRPSLYKMTTTTTDKPKLTTTSKNLWKTYARWTNVFATVVL